MKKLFNSEKCLKCLVLVLTLTMIALGGATIGTFAETSSNPNDGTKTTSATTSNDETVYVLTDADGSENQRIVSENGTTHYDGYEDAQVPVTFDITYTLDGKKVSAEDIAGKSGHVVMTINYTNNQPSVPFLAGPGMRLSNDYFSNVKVTNGKAVDDGNRNVIVGYALPGMTAALGVSNGEISIPESVTVSADVDNFQIETIYTFATNSVFNEMDLSNVSNLDELTSQLDTLTAGIDTLVSGTTQINDGATKLAAGVNTLDATLNAGVSDAQKTAIANQAKQVVDSQFADSSNAQSYANIKAAAAASFKATVLSDENIATATTAAQQMVGASLADDSEKLKGIQNQAAGTAQQTFAVGGTTLNGIITQAQTTAAGQSSEAANLLVTALTQYYMTNNSDDQATATTKATAVVQAFVGGTIKSTLEGTVPAIAGQVASSTAGTVAQGVGNEVAGQVAPGVLQYVGSDASCDKIGTLVADNVKYAAETSAGTSAVTAVNSTQLTIANTIENAGLVSGATQLAAGTKELKAGVDEMATEVKSQLSKLSSSDLLNVINNAKALGNASKSYNSFGSKGTYESVKFIYKTAEISPK